MDNKSKSAWEDVREEIQTTGQHLLKEIHKIIAEGNVRKIVVKSNDGHVYLTIPLTAGAVAGGIITLGAPWLTVLAAIAGLVADVKIEVVRDAAEAGAPAAPPKAESPASPEMKH